MADFWQLDQPERPYVNRADIRMRHETRKTHGRLRYGHVSQDDLRRIQATYNMDLGFPDPEPEDAPENVPHIPHVHPKATQTGLLGVHGALGVHAKGDYPFND